MRKWAFLAFLGMIVTCTALAALPPVPIPTENPLTEEKRVLGKILFWDEQLSADNTVSCGSCHSAGAGGADPRVGLNPGPDTLEGTPDDILGSPGITLADVNGVPMESEVFGTDVQVTGRASMAAVGAAYVPQAFWDGRAGTTFVDPQQGGISIATGGALENQALGPILSEVEMANQGRTWDDVTSKLAMSAPLGHATSVPADVRDALDDYPTYRDLFAAAYGDEEITAERIAFAIATYERTLIADETPWDRFTEGDPTAMTQSQIQGWNFFRNSPCANCHAGPTFTNHTFRNIGLRPVAEDPGRQEVTGLFPDRGRFKVPTLRNVGLKLVHMHNGRVGTVRDAVLWYRPNNPQRFNDNLDPLLPVGVPPNALDPLVDFLTNGLTDPRVAAQVFPFDQPTLHGGDFPRIEFSGNGDTLTWPPLEGVQSYRVYRGNLSDLLDGNDDGLADGGYGQCISQLDANPADNVLIDADVPTSGNGYYYLKTVVDAQGVESGLGVATGGLIRSAAGPCE